MSHVRTQIRNAVVGLLDSLTTTGDRIYTSRLHPLQADKLPALRVFVDDEQITRETIHSPAMLSRLVTVRVDCVSAGDTLDDDLDQMALEVENAIAGDATLGGLLNGNLVPSGIEVERNSEGDRQHGRLTVVFETQYEVMSNAADVAL